MPAHSPRRKLTYEDFAKIPQDRRRHEILDGVHVMTATPYTQHQLVSGATFVPLYTFVKANRLGEVYHALFDVLLSDHDIVEPDLLFVSASRLAIVTEDNVKGAPDLLIEIVSAPTRRRDLGQKRARYEKLGVQEYWALDPGAETTHVFRRDGDRFLPPILLSAEADDRLTTPLLPGFQLSLREVFER